MFWLLLPEFWFSLSDPSLRRGPVWTCAATWYFSFSFQVIQQQIHCCQWWWSSLWIVWLWAIILDEILCTTQAPLHVFRRGCIVDYGSSSELEELGRRTHSCLLPLLRLLFAIRSLLRITSRGHKDKVYTYTGVSLTWPKHIGQRTRGRCRHGLFALPLPATLS